MINRPDAVIAEHRGKTRFNTLRSAKHEADATGYAQFIFEHRNRRSADVPGRSATDLHKLHGGHLARASHGENVYSYKRDPVALPLRIESSLRGNIFEK